MFVFLLIFFLIKVIFQLVGRQVILKDSVELVLENP